MPLLCPHQRPPQPECDLRPFLSFNWSHLPRPRKSCLSWYLCPHSPVIYLHEPSLKLSSNKDSENWVIARCQTLFHKRRQRKYLHWVSKISNMFLQRTWTQDMGSCLLSLEHCPGPWEFRCSYIWVVDKSIINVPFLITYIKLYFAFKFTPGVLFKCSAFSLHLCSGEIALGSLPLTSLLAGSWMPLSSVNGSRSGITWGKWAVM